MKVNSHCIVGFDFNADIFIQAEYLPELKEDPESKIELFNFCPMCGTAIDTVKICHEIKRRIRK